MIDPALLEFLKELAQNNNKPWFEERKADFKKLDNEFKDFTAAVMVELNQNDVIEKAKNYRIYRDIRFSKDKTPFKAHRSVNWLRAGADRRGSYYMRIKPNENVIGIGFFGPEKEDLLRIRKELELDAQEMRDIISSPSFKSCWGELQGEQLKTAPRNFDKNHPDIDLIRFKAFYFMKSYTDKEVTSPDFMDKVIESFHTGRTFLDYMTDVLTTDLNGESLL
ncbi:uncharacterized protein (TIGR02453 family) [Nonlabens xylanidelens]|uniref:Uncharacterized protein (TIGR02453 family) n=1 Tax=Nonlabens xylanidelens TaxID=191564 RepID=A0A2S6IIH4_9FLAO|nr:DUF2461 domain-containing protein [Nonlabens xylanidelens]PPK93985.1 uncharacterized protein (TIGR02453 family) [Nonlabens xylanidelens]PQJ22140.1 TIGR02453 family protein [Nonlabens xylanidelens]